MNKNIYKLILLLFLINSNAQGQENIISIYGGTVVPMGKNSENYDIGYKAGGSFELVPFKNFGLELNVGYSYLYCEIVDYMPYFGAWVDNNIPFIGISPKLLIPGNKKFRFHFGPEIVGSYIMTKASIYYLAYNGGTNVIEEEWEEKNNKLIISLNGNAGFDFFINENFGFGFTINYQALNLNNGTTSLPIEKYGIDNNKIDIKGLGINLKLNLKL